MKITFQLYRYITRSFLFTPFLLFLLVLFPSFTITPISAQTGPLPDLAVSSFKQLPDGRLELVIVNNGEGEYRYIKGRNANQLSILVSFESNNRYVGSTSSSYSESFVLSPGGTLGPWIIAIDPQYYHATSAKVSLDFFRKVAESDESATSNDREIVLTKADFEVYQVSIASGSTRADARPIVSVINKGSALYEKLDESNGLMANWKWKDATGAVVGEGNSYIGDQGIHDGGQYKQIQLETGPMPETAIQAVVTVDSTNVYSEYNERNNGGSGYLNVSQYANDESGEGDLIVESVALTPERRIKAVIANMGTKAVLFPPSSSAPLLLFEMVSSGQEPTGVGSKVFSLAVPNGGMIPGQRYEYTYPQEVAYFTTRAAVTIDPTGVLTEKKGNNFLIETLPLADLTFDPITFDENRTSHVRLKNIGERTATLTQGSVSVLIEWLDDTNKKIGEGYINTLSEVPNSQLDPGQSHEIVVRPDQIPTRGSISTAKKMTATFVINSDFFSETNPGNNIVSADMPAVPLPDLELKNLRATGKVISFEIENISQIPFSGNISAQNQFEGQEEQYFLSLGTISLLPGQTISKQYTPNTTWMGKESGNLTVTVVPSSQEDKAANNTLSLYYEGEDVVPVADAIKAETEQAVTATVASSEGEATPSAKSIDLSDKKAYAKGILPDSPLYIFKEVMRDLQETFTFDTDKKMDLVKKYANEKVLEANALDDKGKKHAAANHLKSYSEDVDSFRKYAEEKKKKGAENGDSKKKKLKAGEPNATDKELELLSDQLNHQVIIKKIETNSETDGKALINKAKKDVLADVAEVIKNKSEEAVREKVAAKLKTSKGTFSNINNLETLGAIEENYTNENNPVTLAKEDTKTYITNTLASLSDKNKTKLTEYVSKSSSDLDTVQALDELKFVDSDVRTKGVLGNAKDLAVTSVVREMQVSREKRTEYADEVLETLKEGTFDDVRLAANLEKKSQGSLKNEIGNAKKDSAKKFAKTVATLDGEKRRDFVHDELTDQLDIQQVKLLNDLTEYVPDEDKKNIGSVIGDVDEVVVGKLETKKTDSSEYNNFVTSFVGDTPEELTYVKKYVTIGGKDFEDDIIKAQVDYFQEYYANVTDPEELAMIREFIEGNSEWNDIFDEYAESNFWEEDQIEYADDEGMTEDNLDNETDNYTDSEPQTTSGCAIIYDPVCGTDGLNYANECEAKDSSIEVAYTGECQEESSVSDDESQNESEDVQGAATYRLTWPAWWPFH